MTSCVVSSCGVSGAKPEKREIQRREIQKREILIVEGGARLSGEVAISGAKNAVLPLMSAALLSTEECIIKNMPTLDDVLVMLSVLRGLGVKAELSDGVLKINASRAKPAVVCPELLGSLRASNLILGPMLARFGEAEIGACGGCTIGARPLDLHFKSLSSLGAKILPLEGGYFAFAPKLLGCEICLDFPSVGATENLLMAATLAEGETVVHNAAAEPEIAELAAFINAMGGKISGAGTSTLRVEGVKRLGGACHTVMPDRIETGTFLLAAALLGEDVYLRGARACDNEALLGLLGEMGAEISCDGEGIRIWGGKRILPISAETAPYPGLPTDLQPQLCAVLSFADGCSKISENIFESRFGYVNELKKMGATIQIEGNCAIIDGKSELLAADMTAGDLRAGAALVIAALGAAGQSRIGGLGYLDRGYENFAEKLAGIGAKICRKVL